MNHFDTELEKSLKTDNIHYERLPKKDEENLINKIQQKITFSGSQINWKILQNATDLSHIDKSLAFSEISEKLNSLGVQRVIFLGDSAIEYAYSIAIADLRRALDIFAEFPQHTYIFPEQLHWIACLAFEGHIDYADLPYDEA
ncbi:hypothetical protein AU074_06670 [Pseudomonas sp. ATCC PTA-122608]|jgi:hypothetical protein|uniref:hypothetical protein n=1 Tax=unclassified Pseudomonas TaxID=196821 RepID=UPI00096BC3BC|nr:MULTISPECIES: hypothetical protein [unclassified Pseudomonas]NIL17434.1 hypothetical protein [Pseudomonas sp. AN3A02]OLY73462.1 hypothetical protein AU074_06670 [Pseudomonas sp. ATCC PTA-122608]